MKFIQLKKVTADEIDVLMDQISLFVCQRNEVIKSGNKNNIDFYVSYILIDILMRLTLKLRNKIEQNFKNTFSIGLTISEASALFLLCNREASFLTDYQKHVLLKTRNTIDQQLTNLN